MRSGWLEELLGLRCPGCGRALDTPALCQTCRSELVPKVSGQFAYLGSYVRWKGLARSIKYRGKQDVVPVLAKLLARTVGRSGWEIQTVTAVPTLLHRKVKRGYNQAELLARGLALELGLPYLEMLSRKRYTPSQTKKSPAERLQLPADTFTGKRVVKGAVLLVDDVITSGATFLRAREALLEAGAEKVYGACIAVRASPETAIPGI